MELTRIAPEAMSTTAIEENLSAFTCGGCGTHATKEAEHQSIHENFADDVYCEECGFIQSVVVTVEGDSLHLLDEDKAREAVWYHATDMKDWHEKVSTGWRMRPDEFLFAHVGTEKAARDIATKKYFQYNPEAVVYLYRITLKEGTVIADYIADDMMIWEGFDIAHEESLETAEGDAVRYLNRWEAPGSISLLVNASKLEFMSVETITAQ
jgi:predicted RNA-binding Zn-ribbon protein involved in translation (DUF1610 family)